MYTDFPAPFAPHIMMRSDGGTASGDLLAERAAEVFDVLSMKADLAAGDSDHIRAGSHIGVRHEQQRFRCCSRCWAQGAGRSRMLDATCRMESESPARKRAPGILMTVNFRLMTYD